MKYKSQVSSLSLIAGIILIGSLLVFEGRFVSSLLFPLILIVVALGILAGRQWYEIKPDRIIGCHIIKVDIPFSSIIEITVMKQKSNIRARSFNSAGFKANIAVTKDILSGKNIGKVTSSMDELNKATTVGKVLLPFSSAVLFISTEKGEVRIMPKETSQFINELISKFKTNQNRELPINYLGLNL